MASALLGGLVTSGPFRLAFVVIGGLFILSTPNLGLAKVAYFLGSLVAGVIAVHEANISTASTRALLWFCIILGSLGVLSFFVALVHGISKGDWFRAALPLFLIASTPLFALDVSSTSPRNVIVAELVVAGLVGGAGYAFYPVSHGYHGHQILWTQMLPVALLCYACAVAMSGCRNRLFWTIVAAAVLVEMLLSTERSVWGVAIVPLFITATGRRPLLANLAMIGLAGSVAAIGFVFVLPSFAHVTGTNAQDLKGRLFSVWTAAMNPRSDPSNLQRIVQTAQLTEAFVENPIFGTAPGKVFPQVGTGRVVLELSTSVNDSPMEFPAKYGAIGVLLLVVAVFQLIKFGRSRAIMRGKTPALLGLGAYGLFAFIVSVVHSPIVDKGFAFGLILLIALSIAETEPAADRVILEFGPPLKVRLRDISESGKVGSTSPSIKRKVWAVH